MKKEAYKIEFVDRILDPVHGFIDVTLVEQRIIELPIFRRLQGIKQLSMANWVFPGAEHTRYIHSLGVMYIADQMAIHMGCFDDGDRQLLRLAGLLHDIGHYPLSHVTESVYRDSMGIYDGSLAAHNESIRKKLEDIYRGSGENEQEDIKIPEYMESRYADKMHHETIGTEVIRSDKQINDIITQYCDFVNLNDVCDIIAGHVDRNVELSAYVQMLHSELDADGIDYIMRDASFAGTSYGGFELGMLLRNLTVREYKGIKIVGVKPKGIPVVDQYLINKYFSYTQIIFNKHVSVLDMMVEKISHAMIYSSGTSYPNPKELKSWIKLHDQNKEYLLFSDVFFWAQVTGPEFEKKRDYIDEPYIKTMLDMLVEYSEPECLDEFIISSNDRKEAKNKLKQSDVYGTIGESDKEIYLFHSRAFTKEMPEDEYRRILSIRWDRKLDENSLFEKTKIRRLQEGIAVIDESYEEPHLLVDDSRSVMSSLWKDKKYILRKYRCDGR